MSRIYSIVKNFALNSRKIMKTKTTKNRKLKIYRIGAKFLIIYTLYIHTFGHLNRRLYYLIRVCYCDMRRMLK